MGTYHIKMEESELEMAPRTEKEQKQRKTEKILFYLKSIKKG